VKKHNQFKGKKNLFTYRYSVGITEHY